MKTVFVGLSGGVDSAVSAYLLKKEGYRVVGAFIKAWEPPFLPCTGARDRLEAMRVAAHLGIPFVTYDLAQEYKRAVVDSFIDEYRAGRTPNPDVLCNRMIKFGSFWEMARADGADFIATGHYARNIAEGDFRKLGRAADAAKEQSYFLWTLRQDDLAHTLFPVGGIEKSEVRELAREAGLPNAGRRDSQGLCFLGHVDMKDFLLRYVPREPGPVFDLAGNVIGEHDGVAFYTVGERYPIEGARRLYVIAKDPRNRTLTLSPEPVSEQSGSKAIELEGENWIRLSPEPERRYAVQVRYHGESFDARITREGDRCVAYFEKPVLTAEGQSLVAYDAATGECIGGGIISLCRSS